MALIASCNASRCNKALDNGRARGYNFIVADDELTFKQEKFVQKYVELDGNGTQAALAAGYSPNSAPFQASMNLKKPNIAQRLSDIANEVGLTARKALGTVNAALDASKALIVEREVTYEPDWNARLRASDLALKVHGLSDGPTNNTLNVFSPESMAQLAEAYYKKKSLENKDNL